MSLDRQTIEKRDFPIGRRGYEPEAVDEHLAWMADRIEALKRESASRSPEPQSLAVVASQQVASIVQAAETTAAEIERQAKDESDRIRHDAEAEARSAREDAAAESQAHVGRVSDSVAHMLQRVDAMESELTALVETLRTGSNRLQADLALLVADMSDLAGAGGARHERVTAVAGAPAPFIPPPAPADTPPVPYADEAAPADDVSPDSEPEPAPVAAAPAAAAPVERDEDLEGARLIALNMALNGTSREDTDRYLADNFDLAGRAALLDEVYSSIEG